MRGRRGFAMGSVLLLALIVVLFGVSIGALATFQLISAQQAEASRDAVLLAESAINQGIQQLSQPPIASFGVNGTDTLVYQPDGSDASRTGEVTFNPANGIPYSTNNLNPDPNPSPVAWDTSRPGSLKVGYNSIPVAPGFARLIGVGKSRGVQRNVEVMLTRRHFPYALAWQGTLSADSLNVIGAGSLYGFVNAAANPSPPGGATVACLGTLSTSNPVFITGDLYYSGTVPALPAGSTLFRTEQKVSALEIPVVPITNLISSAFASVPTTVPTPYPGPNCSGGYFTTNADPAPNGAPGSAALAVQNAILAVSSPAPGLTVTGGGDLEVTDGVLLVAGNLTIQGGGNLVLHHGIVYVQQGVTLLNGGTIRGSGAVIAQGPVNMTSLPAVDPNTEVGVVSGNSITVAAPTAGGVLQGLFYASTTLALSGSSPATPLQAGGTYVSLGDVSLTNTNIVGIQESDPPAVVRCHRAAKPDPGPALDPAAGLQRPGRGARLPPRLPHCRTGEHL
ncbi:MAG: hypothetical protein ACYCW6_11470 [Candidatus Xenobia bacterium]